MNKRFIISGVLTAFASVSLHGVTYFLFLKDFYQLHPAVSEEFRRQLSRPPDQLVVWAMVVTSLAMGFLVTTVIKWSGASSFASGAKYGGVLAILYWASVNFGLYASSNFFSLPSLFVDYVCSVVAMTISGSVAAWALGSGRTHQDSRSSLFAESKYKGVQ
jgi:hypothetical protein